MSGLRAVPAGGHDPVPANGPADLADLLRSSARGDQEAFGRLYDAVSARVLGLVTKVVRDRAQSEEVAQEVFVDVWRNSARFDPARGSALSWLMTIAHRKAVDRVRSVEASHNREDTYEASRGREFDQTAEEAESNIESARVRKAVMGLSEAQRGAIELAYFGGYTHNEVAKLLDLPLGTAKTRIRDGLIRLRDSLGGQS